MPASKQQTTLWVADTLSWLLHFTRKFNLAIQSRFPDFSIIASLPLLIHSVQWDNERKLLCYSDRIAQDSHLIPFSDCYADNSQHFICSIWNYTDIIVARLLLVVNKLSKIFVHFVNFFSFVVIFYQIFQDPAWEKFKIYSRLQNIDEI